MNPETIIAEQKNEIAKLRSEAKTQQGWIIALACALTLFFTLTVIVTLCSAETEDKLKAAEAALAILKK